jgi:hypothetical protein
MGTRADFYLGRGPDAEWLGSIAWDGDPLGVPQWVTHATDPDIYRDAVLNLIGQRRDAITAAEGWPWKWDDSQGTNYAYAFDEGRVWASCYGSSWWKAAAPEPDHTTLVKKEAIFPDMTLAKKVDPGDGRQHVYIVPKG